MLNGQCKSHKMPGKRSKISAYNWTKAEILWSNQRNHDFSWCIQTELGAILLQKYQSDEWHPVAHASRAMTTAEMNYAQIEKECLALQFVCERFHQFVFVKNSKLRLTISRLLQQTTVRVPSSSATNENPESEIWSQTAVYSWKAALHCWYTIQSCWLMVQQPQRLSLKMTYKHYVHMIMSALPVSTEKLEEIKTRNQERLWSSDINYSDPGRMVRN